MHLSWSYGITILNVSEPEEDLIRKVNLPHFSSLKTHGNSDGFKSNTYDWCNFSTTLGDKCHLKKLKYTLKAWALFGLTVSLWRRVLFHFASQAKCWSWAASKCFRWQLSLWERRTLATFTCCKAWKLQHLLCW